MATQIIHEDNTPVTSRDYVTVTKNVPPDEAAPVVYKKKKAVFRSYQIVWIALGVIEFLLGFRFLLRFMGANPASGFAQFIYTVSYPFAAPFVTLFRAGRVGNSIFEWGIPIGMIFYLLLANFIIYLAQLLKPASPEEIEQAVDYRS